MLHTYYRGCWHVFSRSFSQVPSLSSLSRSHIVESFFITQGRCIRKPLSAIFPLLPPQEPGSKSASECGWTAFSRRGTIVACRPLPRQPAIIRRGSISYHRSFSHCTMVCAGVHYQLPSRYPPCMRQVTHALLTRPSVIKDFKPK